MPRCAAYMQAIGRYNRVQVSTLLTEVDHHSAMRWTAGLTYAEKGELRR